MELPRVGDKRTEHGYEWVWVAGTDKLPSHWKSTDGTEVAVLPPSGDTKSWAVFAAKGNSSQFGMLPGEREAWLFAIGARMIQVKEEGWI